AVEEHHSTRAERARSGARFNGATAMEPWKSGKQMTGRTIQRRFNGATAMEPWKRIQRDLDHGDSYRASMGPRRWSRGRGRIRGVLREDPEASMGPRRWSRGRARSRGVSRSSTARFNGATAMEPWKSRTAWPA